MQQRPNAMGPMAPKKSAANHGAKESVKRITNSSTPNYISAKGIEALDVVCEWSVVQPAFAFNPRRLAVLLLSPLRASTERLGLLGGLSCRLNPADRAWRHVHGGLLKGMLEPAFERAAPVLLGLPGDCAFAGRPGLRDGLGWDRNRRADPHHADAAKQAVRSQWTGRKCR